MPFSFSLPTNLKIVPLTVALLCAACSANVPPANNTDVVDTNTVEASSAVSGEPVYFGVLAIDSAISVNERYSLLMDYLSTEIGRPVELVILTQDDQFTQVAEGKLDFTTNNPLASVQIQRLYDTEFLVTHTRPNTGTEFSGLIVVNSESEITEIEDLKGKRAACVNFQTAAAGCTFQIYHLQQNDFDPFQDFSSFIENKSQDNIVLALLNDSIDVGFIRTGQLEKMVKKGLLTSTDQVRIINVADDDFFYPHTTGLYPEWPIAKLPDTDPQLADQVQSALMNIPDDHPALAALKVEGFVSAVEYGDLDTLIETLQLKSWDAN